MKNSKDPFKNHTTVGFKCEKTGKLSTITLAGVWKKSSIIKLFGTKTYKHRKLIRASTHTDPNLSWNAYPGHINTFYFYENEGDK